uniref:Uncharacterized protein n=1 Tax=Moniliophthora roreri TaxID=221103 RepID=A0A0W0G0D5_MONRR
MALLPTLFANIILPCHSTQFLPSLSTVICSVDMHLSGS